MKELTLNYLNAITEPPIQRNGTIVLEHDFKAIQQYWEIDLVIRGNNLHMDMQEYLNYREKINKMMKSEKPDL